MENHILQSKREKWKSLNFFKNFNEIVLIRMSHMRINFYTKTNISYA